MKRYLVVLSSEDEITTHEVEWSEDIALAVSALAQAINSKATWSASPKMHVKAVVDYTPGETFELPNGELLAVHHHTTCAGRNCSIHNPSDHPLKDAPLNWRGDLGLMERICPHDCGHPDPDDLAHKRRAMTHEQYAAGAYGVHGCCGKCCRPTDSTTTGDAA